MVFSHCNRLIRYNRMRDQLELVVEKRVVEKKVEK